MSEIRWVPVFPGTTKYLISDSGIVSGPRGFLKPVPNEKGYLRNRVNISEDGGLVPKVIRIHRAVAKAFVPNPENLPEVNHIDGNKANNHYSNLEWVSRLENMRHAYKAGLAKNGFGDKSSRAVLTEVQVLEIRARHKPKCPVNGQTALGKEFGVTNFCIWRVVHRKCWTHI